MSPEWAKPDRVKDTPQYLPVRWVRDKALAEIAKREVREGLAHISRQGSLGNPCRTSQTAKPDVLHRRHAVPTASLAPPRKEIGNVAPIEPCVTLRRMYIYRRNKRHG